jgi:hypothetical protein
VLGAESLRVVETAKNAAETQCLLSAGPSSLNLVLWLVSGIEARVPATPVKNFTSRRQRAPAALARAVAAKTLSRNCWFFACAASCAPGGPGDRVLDGDASCQLSAEDGEQALSLRLSTGMESCFLGRDSAVHE